MPNVKAPFSFHCTICFELLDLEDRAPVVLPCGHTYICEQCSKKLDKCMECRLPLVKTVLSRQSSNSNTQSVHRQARRPMNTLRSSLSCGSIRHQSQAMQPRPTKNFRLPTPRNQVLMCLIEATQNSKNEKETEDGYESGDDDELVLQGLKVMGSSSGTYVCKEKDGLIVHPLNKGNDELVETTTANNHPGQGYHLKYGQTVQIFLFENGIATVARGAGFIFADSRSQLVKVREVTDEACKLEAISMTLSVQLKELQAKVEKIEQAKAAIDASLCERMAKPDAASPFGAIPESTDELADIVEPGTLRNPRADETCSPILETQSYDEPGVSILPKLVPPLETARSFENLSLYVRQFGRKQKVQPTAQQSSNYFWSTFFAPATDTAVPKLATPRVPIPRQPPPESETSQITSNSAKIDFACGLSGHRGLSMRNPCKSPRRHVMSYSHRRIY